MRTAALLIAAAAPLVLPAAALADSASISVTDPSAEIATVHTLSYQTATPKRIHVKYRPTGGQPCAPTADDDPGTWMHFAGAGISGAGSAPFSWTWRIPGQYQVCFWIASSSYTLPTFATSQIMTVRAPTGTLQISAPPRLAPGRTGVFGVTGQTEVGRYAFLKYRPVGGQPCAPTADDDPGNSLGVYGERVQGAYAVSRTASIDEPGTYQLCAWLASSSGATPTAATSTVMTVANPVLPLAVTALRTSGRRVAVTTRVPGAGTLVVRVIRTGTARAVPVTRLRATGARRISVSWTLPRRYRSGAYAVIVFFRPDTGAAREIRRSVRLG